MNIVVRRTDTGILILVVPRLGEEDESRALGRLIEHFRYTDDPGDPDDDVLYASVAPAISDALEHFRYTDDPGDPDDELYARAASPIAAALDHLGGLAVDAQISRLAGIPVYHDETVPPGVVELRRRGETVGTLRL
jgi:hypothetical protein